MILRIKFLAYVKVVGLNGMVGILIATLLHFAGDIQNARVAAGYGLGSGITGLMISRLSKN